MHLVTGLAGSLWGYTDGSWMLIDFNNDTLSQGSGNFGYETSIDFYINGQIPIFVEENYGKVK